ncbi:hypothetical protein ACS0TY_007405 [Phlomoides rotata]
MARRRNVGMLSANFGQSPVDGTNIPEMPDHVAHRQSASQIPASSANSAGSPEIPSCSTNSARSSTGRIYMYLRGDIIEPSEVCSRAIRQTFEERQDYEGFTWKKVSEQTKVFYFSEFEITLWSMCFAFL